ncbi:MAG: type II toxin-antitoxin system VapC family toxin [Leptospirales bacterium]
MLDTHALLWWLLDEPELSLHAREVIASPDNRILVSSVSAWEISTKHRLGKLPEAKDVVRNLSRFLYQSGLDVLPISFDHALEAGRLPGPHRDPFDRMLIAQSRIDNLPIITLDPVFKEYSVQVVW